MIFLQRLGIISANPSFLDLFAIYEYIEQALKSIWGEIFCNCSSETARVDNNKFLKPVSNYPSNAFFSGNIVSSYFIDPIIRENVIGFMAGVNRS